MPLRTSMRVVLLTASAVTMTTGTGVTVGSAPAQAQLYWWGGGYQSSYRARQRARMRRYDTRRRARRRTQRQQNYSAKPTQAAGPILTVISIKSQKVTVYDRTGSIMRGNVSTGKPGHRTPTGIFHILQKRRFHRSNLYSGAPMPFMQRLTWSGIALHAGRLPGYPASHGCIRMTNRFASQLFSQSAMGMRVVVAPRDTKAVPISHAKLPNPRMVAVAPERPPAASPEPTIGAAVAPVLVAAANGAEEIGTRAVAPQVLTQFLNPQQRADLRLEKLKVAVKAAPKVAKQRLAASRQASKEADAAVAAVKDAEKALAAAQDQLVTAQSAALEAETADDVVSTTALRESAEAGLAAAEQAVRLAKAVEAKKVPTSFAAAVRSREADEAVPRLRHELRIAKKTVKPLALFISKRKRKIYGSQGWHRVFEAPVVIRQPHQPIGTHLYVALGADQATGQLSWTRVTMPVNPRRAMADRGPVYRGRRPTQPIGPPSTAAEALDRIEIPPDIMKIIRNRVWAGASLIITDNAPGNETGKYTDHIVQTY